MHETSFTHLIFWENPFKTLTFFSLIMSFASLWMRRSAWLWGSFLVISFALALQAKVVNFLALIPILLLLIVQCILKYDWKKPVRLILAALIGTVSFGLWLHVFPGFHNWELAKQIKLSPDSLPFNLWLNYDKPFSGIFILALSLPLISSKIDLRRLLKIAVPLSLMGVILLMLLALWTGLVQWDPKVPAIFFVWIISNLFFVCIPEEALMRGFLQTEIYQFLGKKGWANPACVLFTSVLFTLLHVQWFSHGYLMLSVFVAGIIYGSIYQYTKAIESSIMCHFLVNFFHFALFSYPALA